MGFPIVVWQHPYIESGPWVLGAHEIERCYLTSIWIPTAEIIQLDDLLMPTMGNSVLRSHLYFESELWCPSATGNEKPPFFQGSLLSSSQCWLLSTLVKVDVPRPSSLSGSLTIISPSILWDPTWSLFMSQHCYLSHDSARPSAGTISSKTCSLVCLAMILFEFDALLTRW